MDLFRTRYPVPSTGLSSFYIVSHLFTNCAIAILMYAPFPDPDVIPIISPRPGCDLLRPPELRPGRNVTSFPVTNG